MAAAMVRSRPVQDGARGHRKTKVRPAHPGRSWPPPRSPAADAVARHEALRGRRTQTAKAAAKVRLASRNCGHSGSRPAATAARHPCAAGSAARPAAQRVRRSSSWSARAIHDLALLDPAFADRGLFGPAARARPSRHRFRPRLIGAGLGFQRHFRSFLVSARSLRARAAWAERSPDVGRLLAQGVDLRRHQALLVRQ